MEDSESPPRLHVLEARTGRRLESLRPLTDELGRVLALSWTGEGLRVACMLYGGRPALMDYASSRVRVLEAQETPWADDAAFSADGQRVAMVDTQGSLRVWSTDSGRLLARARPVSGLEGAPGSFKAVALSADGRHAAWSTGGARIHVYDVASRRLRPDLQEHPQTVAQLAFSPRGHWLASASLGDEQCIRVWDVERAETILRLPARRVPSDPADAGPFCPSFGFIGPGARLAWLDGEVLRTRELLTGAITALEVGPVRTHASLSASPGGVQVVAREGSALRTWNLDTGLADGSQDSHSQPVRSVAVSAQGMLAATSDDNDSVRLWALSSGQGLGRLELKAARDCLRFSPEGRWLAVGTQQGRVHLWSCGEGRVLHSFPVHESRLSALVFSPDGLELATYSGQGGDLSVWTVPEGTRRRVLTSGSEQLTCLAYSPDARWLVAGGMDGALFFFEPADGRLSHRVQAPDCSVHQVRFFPDGQRLLSVGLLDSDYPDDGPGQPMLQIWQVDSGRLLTSRRARSLPLELSPDGHLLVSVPWRNPALCVEDAMTGEGARTLLRVPELECHAFSPDLGVWVTGHRDCTALVWETSRGDLLSGAG